MLLLYADTSGADESRARVSGHTRAKGSAWARCLLETAWARRCGGTMPDPAYTEKGKPYFPEHPDVHFSISHTNGVALCVFGTAEVGADVERPRKLYPGTEKRVLSPEEAGQFGFFEVWTLRESYFKLSGRGNWSEPRFRREGGSVRCADGRAVCVLTQLLGCPAALCTWEPVGFEAEQIPIEMLVNHPPLNLTV